MKITYIAPEKEIIAVKQLINQHDDIYTAALVDDSVYSCQGDGSAGSRPSGTAGPYELGKVVNNLITFQPISGVFYTKCFVLVNGL